MSTSQQRSVEIPTPPPPPQTPAATPVIVENRVFQPLSSIPQTRGEVDALRVRRRELSDQLTSASNRREQVANDLKSADASTRPGLEQRLKVLDDRIAQLEADIAQTGRQLAATPPQLLVSTSTRAPTNFGGLSSGQVTAISIVGTIFVLGPLAVAFATRLVKRGPRRDALPPPRSRETDQRLERIEQAVDAMAIEMERVSEGQRYVTKVLTEGPAQQLTVGSGAEDPVRDSFRVGGSK
jgi:hypothetical protein